MGIGMKRWLLFLLLICFAVSAQAETMRGDLEARFANIPKIEHEGQVYRLRSRLTTILLMGVDDQGTENPSLTNRYRSGGQADFLLLLVVDDMQKCIYPLQINRDTMTEITILNVIGKKSGTNVMQICLSHGFGDGKEQSCELTVEAVSGLFMDAPIDYYAALSMNGIVPFNDAIGGVEVTLDEDFSHLDPAMEKGKTIHLQGMQAEYYVRGRMSVGDGSNLARMDRQRTYMHGVKNILAPKIQESPRFLLSLFHQLEEFMITDMGQGLLINLANKANKYEILPIMTYTGESQYGPEGYHEFIPSQESITELVLKAFYEPQ